MNLETRQKPHDRIVTAASKLFYDHGVNPVGIAQICEEANVSKRTLYKHFATKEELAAAAMISLGEAWFEACTGSSADDPKSRIGHVFQMMEPMAEKPDFYGCIFMNTSIELRGTAAPAVGVVKEFKTKLYEYFRQQALLLKTDEPEIMAEQLLLLYDGCSSWIVMHREFPRSTFRTLDLIIN